MDDKNPKGLKNLLTSSEDRGARNKASFSDAASKKPEDLVEEEIDSQVLSILGLEDVFDLTYEEYATLLKEAAVRGRMANSQMTTESVELVTNELKRVKGKTGRFKVKQKKINIDKVLDRKTPSDSSAMVNYQKLLPPTLEKEETDIVKTKTSQDEIQIGIQNILTSLITVRGLLEGQSKSDQETAKVERKKSERTKKRDREDALEKKKEDEFKLPKVISTPIDNFFESIKRYFKNILLGSVVLGLYKWLKNPANEKTINDFGNFLTNNAPLILGGLLAIASLPIASTLFGLTTAIVTGIGSLGAALGGLTTLLPAFGLFGAYIGGQMLFKNIQKYVGGEDAPAVESELYKLKKDLVIRKSQALLMSGEEKKQALKKVQEDEKKLNRIEQELLPRMTKTQSMKRQLRQTKEKLKKDETDLKKLKGYEDTPFYKAKITDIKKSKKIIEEAEKNIPLSQKEQDKLMKDILGPEGAQGDMIDKINKFVKDAQKMVEDLNTGVQPQTQLIPGLPPSAAQPGAGPIGNQVGTPTRTITPTITSRYGVQRGSKTHGGTDLAVDNGTPLAAVSDGQIIDSGTDSGGWGNFLVFRDSQGINHLYGHIQDGYKKSGSVRRGEVIARVGMTGRTSGPHLHWETGTVWTGSVLTGKFDPLKIYSSTAPFTFDPSIETRLTQAQIAPLPVPTPSIPSPTGRSNIVPLPIPTQTQQASQSNSAPLQTPVPFFSSEDPNNMTTLVVKAIYNVVG